MPKLPIKKILFICPENSCRSQVAEAWERKLKGDILRTLLGRYRKAWN